MTPPDTEPETNLRELLSLLKVESQPEANFEERFLYNYKERLAQESVCKPAHSLLWERLTTFLGTRRSLTYGTTSTAGALALAVIVWPGGDPAQQPIVPDIQTTYVLKEIPSTPSAGLALRCGKAAHQNESYATSRYTDNTNCVSLPEFGNCDWEEAEEEVFRVPACPVHNKSVRFSSYSAYGSF